MDRYILLLLCALLGIGCSPSTQQASVEEKTLPNIEFLSQEQSAEAILDETYEPYFSQLQIREISAFVQERVPTEDLEQARAFARDKFASAASEFTDQEKQCITFVLEKVHDLLLRHDIALMAQQPWRLIKIENWLCGGFAHTRGVYIILSQKHIDHLSTGWSDHMTPEEESTLIRRFGALLVHEQMHSLQRRYKPVFETLYTEYWNFLQATVQNEPSIQLHQVSNPDAPIAEWLIPNPDDPDRHFWLRTLLKEGVEVPAMGKDFVDTVFEVEKTDDGFAVKKDEAGDILRLRLSDIPFYQAAFPVTRGMDHPNEITAYMFSDYVVALLDEKPPFAEVADEAAENSALFVDWVKKAMTN